VLMQPVRTAWPTWPASNFPTGNSGSNLMMFESWKPDARMRPKPRLRLRLMTARTSFPTRVVDGRYP